LTTDYTETTMTPLMIPSVVAIVVTAIVGNAAVIVFIDVLKCIIL